MSETISKRAYGSIFVDAVHIFSLCTVAFAYPLYAFLLANPLYFVTQGIRPNTIYAFVACMSLGFPFIVVVATLVVRAMSQRIYRITQTILMAGLFAVAFSPVTRVWADRLTSVEPGWLGIGMACIIGIVLTYQYSTSRFVYLALLLLVPLVVVVPARFLLNEDIQQSLLPTADFMDETALDPKLRPPILFIVFDELPTLSLLDADGRIDAKRYPNFAELAGRATWYPYATTVSDYTVRAVPAILTGRLPRKGSVLPLAQNHPTSLFQLLKKSHTIHAMEQITSLTALRGGRGISGHREASLFSFSTDLFVMSLHLIVHEELADAWVPMDENLWGGFFLKKVQNETERPNIVQAWQNERLGGDFQSDKVGHVEAYRYNMDRFPRETFHFAHMLLPHQPFEFLPSGLSYNAFDWWPKGYRLEDYATEPAYIRNLHQAHLLQVGFVDRLLGQFVESWEQSDLFDESLIVIVADHGMAFRNIRKGVDFRRAGRENLAEVAFVPLLIKYPGQKSGAVDTSNVQTIDIVPTILDVLDAPNALEFDGRSLLDKTVPAPVDKFVMNQADEIFELPFDTSLREYEQAHRDTVAIFSLDNPKSNLFQNGPRLDAIGLPESAVKGRTLNATVQPSTGTHLEAGATKESFVNALVAGTVDFGDETSRKHAQLLVGLNGTIVTQTPIHWIDDHYEFYAILPEDAISRDRNILNYFVLPDEPL